MIRVGLDDFLVKLLGPSVSIELPRLGTKLKQNQKMITLFRGSHLANILAPVSGTVIMVNNKIAEHSEIANAEPYAGGWLCLINPDMPKKILKSSYMGHKVSNGLIPNHKN